MTVYMDGVKYAFTDKQVALNSSLHTCMSTDPLNVVEHTPHLSIDLNKNRSASLLALVWVVGGYTANVTAEFQLENGLNHLANVTAVEREPLSDSLVRVNAVLRFFSGFETAERLTANLTWRFRLFGPEGHSVLVSTVLDFETSTAPQSPVQTVVSSEVILAAVIPLVVIALLLSGLLSTFCILHRRKSAVQATRPPVSDIRKLFQQVSQQYCVYR